MKRTIVFTATAFGPGMGTIAAADHKPPERMNKKLFRTVFQSIMKRAMAALLLGGMVLFSACGDSSDDTELPLLLALQSASTPDLPVVASVDVTRYVGRWYEIAALPLAFNSRCTCVTADYAVLSSTSISVVNACRLDSAAGALETIFGTAFVNDATAARLSVQFFFPFTGPYYIIALADDYSHAMVGDPGRASLFILSRSPTLANSTYDTLIARAAELGFPTANLRVTTQTGCAYFGT